MRLSIAFDGSTSIGHTLPAVLAAEAEGLDGVWSAEHVGFNDAIVPSALYLANTDRLDVGIVGCGSDTRHPGLLAMEMNSLAEFGDGRVRVQVGTGDPGLARSIGAENRSRPLESVEALVAALRHLLAGEPVTMDAPNFVLDGFRLRSRGVAPRIDVMAIRPRMIELAARVGDGVALSLGASLPYLGRVVRDVESHLQRFGKARDSFRISALTVGAVDDDLDAAHRLVATVLSFAPMSLTRTLAEGDLELPDDDKLAEALADGGPKAAAELWKSETIEALSLATTPARLKDRLAEYAGTGIDELGVVLVGPPQPHVATVRALAAARQGGS